MTAYKAQLGINMWKNPSSKKHGPCHWSNCFYSGHVPAVRQTHPHIHTHTNTNTHTCTHICPPHTCQLTFFLFPHPEAGGAHISILSVSCPVPSSVPLCLAPALLIASAPFKYRHKYTNTNKNTASVLTTLPHPSFFDSFTPLLHKYTKTNTFAQIQMQRLS